MRKTIKDKEGNETVYEGTPEELADLERRLREESPIKTGGKRKLLKEEDVRQMFDKIIEDLQKVDDKLPPIWYTSPHGLCTCPQCCPYKPYWIIDTKPWPGYPQPYIGDLPNDGRFITITTTSTGKLDANSSTYSFDQSSSGLKLQS